jgi:hypothetical protein
MKKKIILGHKCTDINHDCERSAKDRLRQSLHEMVDHICDVAEVEPNPDMYYSGVFYNLKMNLYQLEQAQLEVARLDNQRIEIKEPKKKVKKKK